jgi:hypothetical protein
MQTALISWAATHVTVNWVTKEMERFVKVKYIMNEYLHSCSSTINELQMLMNVKMTL